MAVTERFGAEVTDFDALVRFAAGDDVPSSLRALLLAPNLKGLQTLVDQMGAGFQTPGVRRVSMGPSVRSTRRSMCSWSASSVIRGSPNSPLAQSVNTTCAL